MSVKTIYTISVYGKYTKKCINDSDRILSDFYETKKTVTCQIKFNIIKAVFNKNTLIFKLVCYVDNCFYTCGIYKTYKKVIIALRHYMKLAMLNKLLYRECSYCCTKLQYPDECSKCSLHDFSKTCWNVAKIEKKM